MRDNETAKVDERPVHKRLVHTADPDEPKVELEALGARGVEFHHRWRCRLRSARPTGG